MYGAYEVLTHSVDAIDMQYAQNGLPMLLDHDVRQQIGWLEDLTIGSDGVLRAMARQGNHPDAAWAFADMRDGIRPYMSIGYEPLAWQPPVQGDPDNDGDRDNTWTITRWMPMESSTVAIPADVTVGVGRSAELAALRAAPEPATATAPKERHMEGTTPGAAAAVAEPIAPTPTPMPTSLAPSADARRAADLTELVTLGTQNGRPELIAKWIERGISPTIARDELLAAQRAAPGGIAPIAAPAGHVDLDGGEKREYSLRNAILAQLPGGKRIGLEAEVSDHIAARLGRAPTGMFVPLNLDTDPTRSTLPGSTRASLTGQQVGTNADGGYAVQTTVQPLIELLRNRMVCKQAGATVLTGLSDTLQFPRQTSGNTLSWVGENPSSANANTKAALDIITMSPKTAQIDTSFSRRMLAQSSFDVEQFVRNDITLVGAVGLDLAALNGTGSSNQPTGILQTSGIGSVAIGSNGGQPTWPKITSFLSAIQAANADVGEFSWVFTPEITADLLSIAKASNQAVFIMSDDRTVLGYKAYITNQLPKTLTKGTSAGVCHAGILGVFNQLLIGEWGGAMDLLVDPFTGATQNMIAVHGYLMVDIAVRHPGAFAACLDFTV